MAVICYSLGVIEDKPGIRYLDVNVVIFFIEILILIHLFLFFLLFFLIVIFVEIIIRLLIFVKVIRIKIPVINVQIIVKEVSELAGMDVIGIIHLHIMDRVAVIAAKVGITAKIIIITHGRFSLLSFIKTALPVTSGSAAVYDINVKAGGFICWRACARARRG